MAIVSAKVWFETCWNPAVQAYCKAVRETPAFKRAMAISEKKYAKLLRKKKGAK